MGIYSLFSREHLSNLNPPSAGAIKDILFEIATPVFEKMDIHATSNPYIWMSDYNDDDIRKIIQFSYRGTVGSFRIGTNFKFMPVINSKQKIVYKREACHLFEYAQRIVNSKKSISLWHEKSFITSLQKLLHKRISKIETYLENASTITQNSTIAQKQLAHPDEIYQIHDPELHFVLSFLHAKLNNKETSLQYMKAFFKNRPQASKEILMYLEKV